MFEKQYSRTKVTRYGNTATILHENETFSAMRAAPIQGCIAVEIRVSGTEIQRGIDMFVADFPKYQVTRIATDRVRILDPDEGMVAPKQTLDY